MRHVTKTGWAAAMAIALAGLGLGLAVAADDKPYQVAEGNKVDKTTFEGWRTWRALACERCHGARPEGMVGASRRAEMNRWPGRLAIAAVLLLPQLPGAADWPGYEKLTREQVVAALAKASASAPADFYSRNLSGLDLSGIDFKGANLTAAVLNRSNLTGANLSRCNLTVSFAEGANLTNADLRGAM